MLTTTGGTGGVVATVGEGGAAGRLARTPCDPPTGDVVRISVAEARVDGYASRLFRQVIRCGPACPPDCRADHDVFYACVCYRGGITWFRYEELPGAAGGEAHPGA